MTSSLNHYVILLFLGSLKTSKSFSLIIILFRLITAFSFFCFSTRYYPENNRKMRTGTPTTGISHLCQTRTNPQHSYSIFILTHTPLS